jgi:C1A family cysteine protease
MLLNVEMKVGHRLMVAPKPESYSLMGSFRLGPSLYINWTRENKISEVTDQGYCGSCYAHVAVGDI